MGVQKERKSSFLTAFEHLEKSLSACLLHKIFIAVVSECLSPGSSVYSKAPRYLHWLSDFRFLPHMCQSWSDYAFCLKRNTNSFAVVENNSM